VKLILVAKNNQIENDALKAELSTKFEGYEFVFIKPADDSYKIEEIRDFLSKINKKQSEFTRNIFYILKSGDKMSQVVQNSLLKTLEESNYSIGILVKNEAALLPTIRSRCQILYLDFKIEENIDSDDIGFDEISSMAKQERIDVVTSIEHKMYSIIKTPTKAIFYQDALNKLNANCKIESVLVELVEKLRNSN